jgi:hypothetical protein
VPESSERGFELALYYAVTRDEARGKEAIQWARCLTNVLPGQPFDLAEFGFEFSIQQIEQHVNDVMKRIAIRQHTCFSHKEAA